MKFQAAVLMCTISLSGIGACGQSQESPATSTTTQTPAQEKAQINLLPTQEFLAAYESQAETAYLIDCRTTGEYAGGTIANAQNIDFRSPDFKATIAKLDTDKPAFVFCQAGGRSAAAAKVFAEAGFTKIYDLQGGYGQYARTVQASGN